MQDFMDVLNSDPNAGASSFANNSALMGLPRDPVFFPVPAGLESAAASAPPPPPISSSQTWWDTIKQDSVSSLKWVEDEAVAVAHGAADITKAAYGGAKNAVGTVVSDIASPVTGALNNIYWYAILGVVVIGGALYFAGKGGALKSVMGR